MLGFEFVTGTVVLVFLAGLVVGWNVLPQPAWAKNLYEWVGTKFRG